MLTRKGSTTNRSAPILCGLIWKGLYLASYLSLLVTLPFGEVCVLKTKATVASATAFELTCFISIGSYPSPYSSIWATFLPTTKSFLIFFGGTFCITLDPYTWEKDLESWAVSPTLVSIVGSFTDEWLCYAPALTLVNFDYILSSLRFGKSSDVNYFTMDSIYPSSGKRSCPKISSLSW